MAIEDKLFNSFNDSLRIVSYCPTCNTRHNPVEAKILAEKADAHLIHIKCRNCQSAVLAIISVNNLGLSSVGLMTDLSADDVLKFKEHSAVTCDEVIEAYKILTEDKVLIDQLI